MLTDFKNNTALLREPMMGGGRCGCRLNINLTFKRHTCGISMILFFFNTGDKNEHTRNDRSRTCNQSRSGEGKVL